MRSWLKSLFEAWIDIASGFFISLAVQFYVIPWLFDITFTGFQNFGIVLTFTVVSLIRSTIWRKVFKERYKTRAQLLILKTGNCKFCGHVRKVPKYKMRRKG